jgi:tRNA dimethylallyltransferase
MSRLRPLIAVIGTTGVGKSNLAVQIASIIQGDIINADALQVYTGYPIVTNQMPHEDRGGVAHHVMDHVDPGHEYTVTEYQQEALRVVSRINNVEGGRWSAYMRVNACLFWWEARITTCSRRCSSTRS